ncbi:molybdenum ABC transporter ATP-binding protein [Azospirillum sp. ST 5-10]|uniref:molybdenum ABC transporter ATP-binding protein n=1 Tax=unclassified Azospirillum TaxID=2630922 RepID=UPI003F4A524E
MAARFRGPLGAFRLDVAFTAPGRGVTALFGPSGCGKTTVLRCVAGLHRPGDGHFSLDGEVWQDHATFRPTHRRPVGYVFQEASLFAHLSVRDNLLFGRRRAMRGGAPESVRFDDVVGLLGLGRLLDRAPARLSGGERQRVAMGRALLSQPRLLLMDEPLAALDRFSKEEILPYLEALHDALSIPVLYVSHDIAEVERLADHLVLLQEGRVLAAGPLPLLQADPALPIARMPDAGVTLPAVVVGFDAAYGLTALGVEGATLQVPGDLGAVGTRRRVRIAASDVSLARQPSADSTIVNTLPARILSADVQDIAQVTVLLRLGAERQGARVLARVTRKSWEALRFTPGEAVHVQVKGIALVA